MLSVSFRNGPLHEKFPSARFSSIYLSVSHCLYHFPLTCFIYPLLPPFLPEIFIYFIHKVPQPAINFPFKNNPLHLIQAQCAFSAALHSLSLAQLFSSNTALKKSCNHAPFRMSNATKRRFLFHLALPQHPSSQPR